MPELTHQQTAEYLEKAADIIEKRGWTQGELEAYSGGPVCAAGAINAAVTGVADEVYVSGINADLTFHVADTLHRRGRLGKFNMIENWNDKDWRKKQEVLDKFRHVAKLERLAQDKEDAGE